jgi:lipopolysaccharide export system protein LptC
MHEAGGASFAGGGASERARLFHAARRHSRFVRFLRRAIPISLIVTVALVVAAAYFQPLSMLAKLPIDPGRMVISGTKITMEAPRLGGFTRDGRPYDLTARAAAQDLTKPGVLELKDVRAHIEMQDKARVELEAVNGLYDTKADMMWLKDNIVLTSSSGYTARLSEATVDIKTNKIVSDHPVEVKLTNGTVNANHLEVSENGELIRFDNGVVMDVVPQIAAAGTGAATSAGAGAGTQKTGR